MRGLYSLCTGQLKDEPLLLSPYINPFPLTRRFRPSTIAAEYVSIGCVCLSLLMLLYRRETHMKVLSPNGNLEALY